MEISCAFLVRSIEVMTSASFTKLSVLALGVRHFLEWVISVDVSAAMCMYKIVKKKANTHSRGLEKLMSARGPDLIRQEIRA